MAKILSKFNVMGLILCIIFHFLTTVFVLIRRLNYFVTFPLQFSKQIEMLCNHYRVGKMYK